MFEEERGFGVATEKLGMLPRASAKNVRNQMGDERGQI